MSFGLFNYVPFLRICVLLMAFFCSIMLFILKEVKNECALTQRFLDTQQLVA